MSLRWLHISSMRFGLENGHSAQIIATCGLMVSRPKVNHGTSRAISLICQSLTWIAPLTQVMMGIWHSTSHLVMVALIKLVCILTLDGLILHFLTNMTSIRLLSVSNTILINIWIQLSSIVPEWNSKLKRDGTINWLLMKDGLISKMLMITRLLIKPMKNIFNQDLLISDD